MAISILTEFILVFLCFFVIPAGENNFIFDAITSQGIKTISVQRADKGFNLFEQKDSKLTEYAQIKLIDQKKQLYDFKDAKNNHITVDLSGKTDELKKLIVKSGDITYITNPETGTIAAHPVTVSNNIIDTPEKLLKKIYELAKAKKYDELKKHIAAYKLDGTDIQAEIINGIKAKTELYDFAYSDEAMALLVNKHLDKITPIEKKFIDALTSLKNKDIKILKDIALKNPNDIKSFSHKHANIIMVKINGEYKLWFWENLNNLLRLDKDLIY